MGGKFSGPNKGRKTSCLNNPTNRSVHATGITSNRISSHTVHEYERERQGEDFVIVDYVLSEYADPEDYLIKNEFQEKELRKWLGKEHEQKSMETPSGQNATSTKSANISSGKAFGKTAPPEVLQVYHQQKMMLEHYNRNVPEKGQCKFTQEHRQQTLLTEQHQKSFVEEQYHHQPLEKQYQQKLLSEKSQQKFVERHQQKFLGEQHQQKLIKNEFQEEELRKWLGKEHEQKSMETPSGQNATSTESANISSEKAFGKTASPEVLQEYHQQNILLEHYNQNVSEKNQCKFTQEHRQQTLLTEQHQKSFIEEQYHHQPLKEQYQQKLLSEKSQQTFLERQQKLLGEQHQQKFLEQQYQQKILDHHQKLTEPQHHRKLLEKQQQQKLLEKQHQRKFTEEEQQRKPEYQQNLVEEQKQETLFEELQEEEYHQRLSEQHLLKSLECKAIIIKHHQKECMKEQGQQKFLEKQKEEHLKIQHQQKFVERQQQKLVEKQNQEKIPKLFREQQQFELEKQQQQKYVEKQHQKSCLQEQYLQKDLGERKHVKAESYENLLKKECQEKGLKECHQKKCMKEIMKPYKLAETQVKCLASVRSRRLYHAVLRDRLATNWNSMPLNKMFMRIAVEEDTDEFRTVKNCFKATTQKRFEIVKIERVQNPFMLGCYILKKSEMESMYGAPNVKEKVLFRGTFISNIDKICENNFNWRLCADGRGNRYGRGVSLSPISYYATYYSDKNATTKAMFLVRVLTSKIIEGNEYIEIPPPVGKQVGNNNLSNVLRFDTTKRVDEKIIVKYNDNDFYPDYIIYYTVGPMPVKTLYQSNNSIDDYWFDEDFHSSSIY